MEDIFISVFQVQFTSRHKEDVLRTEDEHPDFIHSFHGFSPAGDITGELVYVNYGRVEDIKALEDLGVNLTGKIAISRSGPGTPCNISVLHVEGFQF